jgi:hypothetical protein
MADEKVTLEIVTKSSASGIGSDGGGSSIGGKGGGAGGVAMLLGKVAAIAKIVTDIFWAFKPVISVISQMMKMIGLFLQPIAEAIILIIRPLMEMLKPVVLIFKTMMAPFMNIVRQASSLMSKQGGSGDFSGMMQTGLFIMQTVLSPMILILANIFGKMIFVEGGKMIKNVIINLVADVMGLLFGAIDKIFGTDLKGLLEESRANLIANSDAVLDSWGTTMDTNLANNLQALQFTAENKLLSMQKSFDENLTYAVVDPVASAVDKLIEQKKRLDSAFKSSSGGSSRPKNVGEYTDYDKSKVFTSPGNIYNNSNQTFRDNKSYYSSAGMPWATNLIIK